MKLEHILGERLQADMFGRVAVVDARIAVALLRLMAKKVVLFPSPQDKELFSVCPSLEGFLEAIEREQHFEELRYLVEKAPTPEDAFGVLGAAMNRHTSEIHAEVSRIVRTIEAYKGIELGKDP